MQVSIVLPAYNCCGFIARTIESVLAQTWRDFELIVIDDGSTDNTLEIVKQYAARDERIKVLTQANSGLAATLNRGIDIAANEWVFRMDNDDLMRPNRLERQMAFVTEHPELAVASSLIRHIDDENRVIGKDNSRLFTHEAVDKLVAANELIGFCHPAAVLRKSAVMAVGGYRKQFWPAEDIDLWNRLAEKGYKMLVQPEYLLDYRMHGKSASIAGARGAHQKLRWLKDCMIRRRTGQPELDLESFLAVQRSAPLLTRINRERKDMAKILYKAAVSHYAQKRYVALAVKLLAAVSLQPGYVLRQVTSKFAIAQGDGAA